MIGNDVVDIIQSRKESNWQRHGFLQKLFKYNEQQLIINHTDPETMVWLLWSMKEAAYKIYSRQTGIRKFMPLQLECIIVKSGSNTITGNVSVTVLFIIHVLLLKTVLLIRSLLLSRALLMLWQK